jgi:hypothetical protein
MFCNQRFQLTICVLNGTISFISHQSFDGQTVEMNGKIALACAIAVFCCKYVSGTEDTEPQVD